MNLTEKYGKRRVVWAATGALCVELTVPELARWVESARDGVTQAMGDAPSVDLRDVSLGLDGVDQDDWAIARCDVHA